MSASPMNSTRLVFCLAIFLALWGIGILTALGSAASSPLVLTGKDSGRTLTVPVGQILVVDLNLGAGHHTVTPEFNPEVLILTGQSLQSFSGSQGASSRIIYKFFVHQGGQTDLVIAVKGAGNGKGEPKPLLKVKIVAMGGGEAV